MKKMISLVMCILLMQCIVPIASAATPEPPCITIGEWEFYAGKGYWEKHGGGATTSTLYFDDNGKGTSTDINSGDNYITAEGPANNLTITMYNASLTDTINISSIITKIGTATIVVADGTLNSIAPDGDNDKHCINFTLSSLCVTGSGTLSMRVSHASSEVYGIQAKGGPFNISGSPELKIDAHATGAGKSAFGIDAKAVTIDGGVIDITASSSSAAYGIRGENSININAGASVEIMASGGTNSFGVFTDTGTISVATSLNIEAGEDKTSTTNIEIGDSGSVEKTAVQQKYVKIGLRRKVSTLKSVCSVVGKAASYTSIGAALASATDGDTIQLLDNVAENVVIASNSNLTLDLNGFVLKASDTNSIIKNEGTLSIIDSNPSEPHYFVFATNTCWIGTDTDTGAIPLASVTSTTNVGEIIEVHGGVITGGNSDHGSAIHNVGTLIVSGTNIIGNMATCSANDIAGGAIYSNGNATLTNCVLAGNVSNAYGGAVFASGHSDLFIDGAKFYNNYAKGNDGGAIFTVAGSSLILTKSVFFGNTVMNHGGAICNNGKLLASNCSFIGNYCNPETDNNGGAIDTSSQTDLSFCTFTDNRAPQHGGAIYVNANGGEELVTMTNCTFIKNTAQDGGAIYITNNRTVKIEDTTFTGNTAVKRSEGGYGGAICNIGLLTCEDVVMEGNEADTNGAGLANQHKTRIISFPGVYTSETNYGRLLLSGKVEIKDNSQGLSIPSNLYIASGTGVTITDLAGGSEIHVTTEATAYPVAFASNGTLTDVKYFKSDNVALAVGLLNNHLVLSEKLIVKFNSDGGSTVTDVEVASGTCIEEPEEPTKDEFEFVQWTKGGLAFDFSTPFTTNTTLKAEWKENGHAITISTPTNGTVTVNKNNPVEAETEVKVTATANQGYKLKEIKVYSTATPTIVVTVDKNGKFEMPDYAVTVTATFEKKAVVPVFFGGYSAPTSQLITSELKTITKVTVDSMVVDAKNYTVNGGNVTLTGNYLQTLTTGKHTVRLYNGDKVAVATITVNNGTVKSSKTGDLGIILYAGLAISSSLGIGYVAKKKEEF